MPIVNKREFTVKVDDKDINLAAIRPNQAVRQKSEIEYAKAWASYVKQGMILEVNLWSELRKQKLWDEDKQKQLEEIDKRLDEHQSMLPDEKGKVKKSGITLKKARDAAIQMRIDRIERVRLLSDFTRLKNNTCEGFADNTKFNYLVSNCIVYADTNKPYFTSLDDYLERSTNDDVIKAAEEFAYLYYEHDPDFDKSLPENKFLVKHNMCRKDNLALINKDGELVDIVGNKVDENGDVLVDKKVEEEFDITDDWN